jgi:hypothetical protein
VSGLDVAKRLIRPLDLVGAFNVQSSHVVEVICFLCWLRTQKCCSEFCISLILDERKTPIYLIPPEIVRRLFDPEALIELPDAPVEDELDEHDELRIGLKQFPEFNFRLRLTEHHLFHLLCQ